MRTIFLLLTVLLISCQRTPIQIEKENSENELSMVAHVAYRSFEVEMFQTRLNAIENLNNDEPEAGGFLAQGVHLITHNSLVFLEYLDLEEDVDEHHKGYLEGYKDISEEYNTYSGSCKVYELEDEALKDEYEHLIGAAYTVNNHNRDSETVVVEKLVVVYDPWVDLPYVAAAFETSEKGYSKYHGWTSRVGAISYPFMERGEFFEENDEEEIVIIFQNTPEYSQFEDLFVMPTEYEWTETKYSKFEHFDGTNYHVAQYNLLGDCSSIVENLTAVYSEIDGEYTLLAMDQIDYYFHDLIDINGDGFPEFFGADFSSSVIYTIENGQLNEKTSVNWSIDECPC